MSQDIFMLQNSNQYTTFTKQRPNNGIHYNDEALQFTAIQKKPEQHQSDRNNLHTTLMQKSDLLSFSYAERLAHSSQAIRIKA